MLGWLVGKHIGDHKLNSGLLQQLESSPTLYQALHRLVKMAGTEASDIQLAIHEGPKDVVISTCYPGRPEVTGYHQSQAYQLGVILDLIRHFLGQQWAPDYIGIEGKHVPAGVEALFPRTLILTQQPAGYITVPRSKLHQATCNTKPNCGVADELVLSHNFDFINTLRALLKSYLPDGYPSCRFAAKLMNISERTLARRLSTHGITYGALVDEVRFKEAKRLMQKPNAKLGDVAMAVGFYDQSNFTRMFRRIGGLSPKEFYKLNKN